ncbi:MAG TPA: glycerophosphodiester phosphodiesterase family protein [bacterium]|nr:glycerophosphodiester phosphodiesterase family protein [bacterium]HPN36526.1 glycerophosphodiester phosphodiesterase family protein [bacterium]
MRSTVLNLAHRGASGHAPENTLAAVQLAMELGADGIEIDVHLTRDQEVVLLHDDLLQRTTNGVGAVQDFDLVELRTLDAGSWFSLAYVSEPIPTLQQVLSLASDRLFVNVEIKAEERVEILAARVVDLLTKHQTRCMITSFDQKALLAVAALGSSIPLGFIFEDYPQQALEVPWPILCADYHLLDPAWINRCRQAKKQLFAWTVNESADLKAVLKLGVDGIMTNYPDRLRKLLATGRLSGREER